MKNLLTKLREVYTDLLKDREAIDTNLLKLKELIEYNEKINREGIIPIEKKGEDILTKPSQLINNEKKERENEKVVLQPPVIPKHATAPQPATGYDPSANWQKKINYALTQLAKPATAKEIALKIRELEPDSQKSVDKSVELTTSRMSKDGTINARKEGVKNYYSLKG